MQDVKIVPLTKDHYDRIFEIEREQHYPLIDLFEKNWGYAIDKVKLENAARVLACPFKVNPPNWQHGRIIYTVARKYLNRHAYAAQAELEEANIVHMVDIGTAKGFSALCMKWAVMDSWGINAEILSVDVIDPEGRERRNTVVELDGLKTLREILEPWPETQDIKFRQLGGATHLAQHRGRIHFAFIDGKHKYEAVKNESTILRMKQKSGDIIIFDDVQIQGVHQAVEELQGYQKDYLAANAHRKYCIATRE